MGYPAYRKGSSNVVDNCIFKKGRLRFNFFCGPLYLPLHLPKLHDYTHKNLVKSILPKPISHGPRHTVYPIHDVAHKEVQGSAQDRWRTEFMGQGDILVRSRSRVLLDRWTDK